MLLEELLERHRTATPRPTTTRLPTCSTRNEGVGGSTTFGKSTSSPQLLHRRRLFLSRQLLPPHRLLLPHRLLPSEIFASLSVTKSARQSAISLGGHYSHQQLVREDLGVETGHDDPAEGPGYSYEVERFDPKRTGQTEYNPNSHHQTYLSSITPIISADHDYQLP